MQKSSSNTTVGKKIVKLVICVILPLIVGGISAMITGDMVAKFGELEQPILSPPEWLFPIAWTILYILMGLASFFILQQKPANKLEKGGKIAWLSLYGVQLAFNFMWPIFFFIMADFNFALFWLLALWIMVLVLVFMANRHSQAAMWCMLPYALWVTFAAYLNLMIMVLN
ncbi:tryptophan-rich sensory protein [Candidatus Saccharibacteria bacterium]|nr:tryptophan-rich sensory protein [Candidatus Saccharibacteria bacterium]